MNRSTQTTQNPTMPRKLICIGDPNTLPADVFEGEVLVVDTSVAVVDQLDDPSIEGVWIARDQLPKISELRGISQSGIMLRDMPEGVALLDSELRVLWANRRLIEWSGRDEPSVGTNFYEMLSNPEIMGPDFCPFHTALATGDESNSTLHTEDSRYFQVHAAPMVHPVHSRQLVVTVSDITEEILQQNKLAAIHQAGRELADLRPTEIFMMEVDERIDLLKENIRHYLSNLLNFNIIEIRLLEQATGNLMPLLSVGIDQDAADRQLIAHPQGNGITGYVAASGVSYICHDVVNDPLFIPGVADSRSSLTVPLMLHDQVLGTINIESPEINAFGDSDLQFLEIFARDIAFALNTLELLVAQKANTAQQSCDAIHGAVALPVDEILNDAVNVMEQYIGHSSEVVDRLKRILRNARDIKQTIQQIGQRMTPLEAIPVGGESAHHVSLRGKRILVVDADEQVREDAHQLLERYGCIVETAHKGDEAVLMVRGSDDSTIYDVIISDIKLPDYSGYQLMLRLGKLMDYVPMVLMTGFGYDPGHSIVKARQNGLHAKGVLFKPFRLDQLIDVVKTILDFNEEVKTSGVVPPKPVDSDAPAESKPASDGDSAADRS
ncbi:Signal transduction response regulator, receiver region domain protein [Rhodopirellula maiorica SM1]|uniref:Signal transduction response regulator, receiver region domain protein n=1 Tax=Rhodopirellula maiorica SM1 TaxID=1265738 RepID=M5RPR6_9BACT|nr:response regulator [Rhodopirellula maiorica]EMI17372.1 Signal transduction response regulator, receiver region domain protein [Rhodopirellula maiorica SM1]